ncbi:type II secretion system F family protein [Blastopirellula retiformator]|uniref:Type II secretion system protein F n=1 Tax=Blastopirellula retiformator TaxID=2527970 RepID=A0A5C5UW13_9BACT|nr:type II secretion system F family protein [Blastopirellula retiformator]TWT30059.1 Type II secretion system protein F [Blastopirellula retiformator]
MPTYQFEAMDTEGQEIRDVIDAPTEDEAVATIRQMGYFITRISEKKQRAAAGGKRGAKSGRTFAIGGVSSRQLTTFTRQLAILQNAGLPILRSLKILEKQSKPGRLKNSLMDVCEDIESGAGLSEAMAKCPKCFNRLYVNMIKAGEAGGALEIILLRLADFMERDEDLKRQVKGAMIYPAVVITVAVGILTFIMIKIVPVFKTIFDDFELELPPPTQLLITMSTAIVNYWYVIPLIPMAIVLFIKLLRKFKHGRMGWDLFFLNIPIAGRLQEKNILARTTRTLGTLIASGVPILECLNIARDTSGHAMFEKMYHNVAESIKEGESIFKPMEENARAPFHPVALFLWMLFPALPAFGLMVVPGDVAQYAPQTIAVCAVCGALWYFMRMKRRIVELFVTNMIDVGEETGELDTMLFKVADTYDEDVKVMTESLTKLLEPILIVFLGVSVGFIVVSLFLPLVSLIQNLS